MSAHRGEAPGLAVLQDGRVLVTGGSTKQDEPSSTQSTAELFDRSTTTFAAAGNTMSIPRWWNSAVTMLDGRVLVVGGACTEWLASPTCAPDAASTVKADLFDPTTNTFAPTTSSLTVGRSNTLATLLADGRVLIASANDPSVEIYDPDTGRFKLVAHAQPHGYGFMARLRDGRVLLGGGFTVATSTEIASVEMFDSDAETFAPVGPMNIARHAVAAAALPDGGLLVAGGEGVPGGWLASIERFDPIANTFASMPYALRIGRADPTGVLVRDGTMLVAGGGTAGPPAWTVVSSVDQLDPVLASSTPFPDKPSKIMELSGVALHDGSVLLAGGVPGGVEGAPTSDYVEFLAGAPIR